MPIVCLIDFKWRYVFLVYASTTVDSVTGYLHLTRVKSTNSKKYSKGKIQR